MTHDLEKIPEGYIAWRGDKPQFKVLRCPKGVKARNVIALIPADVAMKMEQEEEMQAQFGEAHKIQRETTASDNDPLGILEMPKLPKLHWSDVSIMEIDTYQKQRSLAFEQAVLFLKNFHPGAFGE